MRRAPGARARPVLLARLRESKPWDMVVIGGGATGLGCAVDAAARGYRVLVVDAHDFAKGTSSRATKLIHGGVRYLAQGNLALVREALAERARLLANAPHLVHALRFVVPAYRWHELALYGVGLRAYERLAGAAAIGHSRRLDRAHTLAALPTLNPDRLRGGIAYCDAQFDDARLALALALTTHTLGGTVLNYCAATGLVVDGGRVCGVELRDTLGGGRFRVAARIVINAAGVWADAVRRLAEPTAAPLLRTSQGVHLVVGRDFLPGDDALLIPRTADGRLLFVIPWQGRVLLGTTDTERADQPLEPQALAGEIEFILATAAAYLRPAPGAADVRSVFAGLRPLLDGAAHTGRLSREHRVEVSAEGLVSVLGGKWTTYRRMAEEAVDVAAARAGLPWRASPTATLRLHGAPAPGAPAADDRYGSERAQVDRLPGARRLLLAGLSLTEAEVRHAVRAEFAHTVEDVLARRHRALFLDAALALAVAPAVATLMAQELGRGQDWIDAQLAGFARLAAGYRAPAGG
ncbi:glycerol-3-phosphate dehydrogenase/oxidase [Thauera phenolivorans]|uniref:glycerol-3-phosphate dehydrogenase/oxidase n=1 Tax=Thauera phenolivorans TaxID=1792543 RepID=UPI00083A7906|nr:glycerol-3-phosphate dehydrogenase/oxidase [Thauera phenolivorans]